MRIVVLLVVLGGCDQLFKLDEVAPVGLDAPGTGVDVGQPCTVEPFEGTTADLSLSWNPYADYATCRALARGGELVFEVDPNMRCYAILKSIQSYSLVGARATVKVTEVPFNGPNELGFALWLDDDEKYDMAYGSGLIGMSGETNNAEFGVAELTYDPLVHVYWRMEHRPDLQRIVFSTSHDGLAFVERNSIEARVSLDALKVSFYAGAYDPLSMVGTGRLDDFELCRP